MGKRLLFIHSLKAFPLQNNGYGPTLRLCHDIHYLVSHMLSSTVPCTLRYMHRHHHHYYTPLLYLWVLADLLSQGAGRSSIKLSVSKTSVALGPFMMLSVATGITNFALVLASFIAQHVP